MSYPQPNSNGPAVNGGQFFRLNTLLSSPGDIYESEQGALGLALGPDSDISRIRVAYYDDQNTTTGMAQVVVDRNRSFVGRVAARNDATYQPAARPGRILFWADDLYDPSYTPSGATGYNSANDHLFIVAPRFDVIEYFDEQPSGIAPPRADREYQFQNFFPDISHPSWLLVPCYGRKYGFLSISSDATGGADLAFRVWGINFGLGSAYTQETELYGATLSSGGQISLNNVVGPGALTERGGGTPTTGTTAGMFDYLLVNAKGGPFITPLRIVLSDVGG